MKKIGIKTIEGSTFLLVKDNLDDTLKAFRLGMRTKEICDKATWVYYDTEKELINAYESYISSINKNDNFDWAIKDKVTNAIIGVIGTHTINEIDNWCEIGYNLNPNFWSKGIMSEALKLVIKYLFTEADFNRIVCKCSPDNIGSYKVMEKNNMIKEGIERQSKLTKEGYKDKYVYSILKSEFDNK